MPVFREQTPTGLVHFRRAGCRKYGEPYAVVLEP